MHSKRTCPMKQDSLYYLAATLICAVWILTPVHSQAAKNRSLNISFEGGNAEHCSDLQEKSNAERAQATDAFTLQKGEAPILEMNGADRSVFHVRGWDRAEYSVETCK